MTSVSSNTPSSRFGYVILCPDRNVGGLRSTIGSINNYHPEAAMVCVVGDDTSDEEFAELNRYCRTIKSGGTITSLINCGMKETEGEWNALVFAGSWVRPNFRRKLDLFIRQETDILFPVVDWKTNFVDGSMNGLVMNKQMFATIGDWLPAAFDAVGVPEMEVVKAQWAVKARLHGCLFKAIIGMRVV
jgi:hypothetical protein